MWQPETAMPLRQREALPEGIVRGVTLGQELLLLPGQLYFGNRPARIKTLLGSCVALTLWHPQRRVGGMCHYLLPERRGSDAAASRRSGRFASDAIPLMVEALQHLGTRAADYEAHLYGGADTLPDHITQRPNIGMRNIEIGWTLVDQFGFQLMGVDVGDHVPRTVELDLRKGEVRMRRSER